jgi:FlaA1/EpsC-like NDP-sugar epimerase
MTYMRNRYFLLADMLLLTIASYGSYVLRLETFNIPLDALRGFSLFTLVVLLIVPIIFWMSGVYSRYWRYASVEEVFLLAKAITIATVFAGSISILLLPLLPSQPIIPRSIPIIFLLLALGATAGPRLFVRLMRRYPQGRNRGKNGKGAKVLIMGAGETGALILREVQHNPTLDMEVAGLVDDDVAKLGVCIHGVPVLGGQKDIPRLVQQYQISQVIIAMPTASGKAIREVVKICEQVGVKTRTLPGLSEIIKDQAQISQLRDVQIEDLLRRAPVATDIAAVQELVRGRRVLVTGGGGSIGSELCRQILRCEPAALIVLGHGENSVFGISNELQQAIRAAGYNKPSGYTPPTLHTVIADIRFMERLWSIFEAHRPEIVFHAAAHKHVPLMEANPAEAVTNNILGTKNLLTCAQQAGVGRFVMISTDKAVNPTNVMGASKRTAELLVHHAALTSGLPYVAVRFGNVLGSRGSVVLTFKQQIAAGGPVTVTHPEITRYFMTISEAVQLVLQAAVLGQGGEIFMLDMGEPVKIVDMARDMIELSGLEVGHDIDIVFTGLRPGEKLYEELFIAGEEYQPTPHEKISIAVNASMVSSPNLSEMINAIEHAAERNDHVAIRHLLKMLVPEYQPPQKVEAASDFLCLRWPSPTVSGIKSKSVGANSPL